MAMKKTSGGDSPLWQGAGKSFWTLPILGRRQWRIAMCFWKTDRVFRFFPSGGLYRRRGSIRSGAGGLTHRGVGQGLAAPPYGETSLWLGSVSSLVYWKLYLISGCSAFVSSNSENISCVTFLKHKNKKNRELALWHLVNRLVLENA
jgi:hypothetical protein